MAGRPLRRLRTRRNGPHPEDLLVSHANNAARLIDAGNFKGALFDTFNAGLYAGQLSDRARTQGRARDAIAKLWNRLF